MDPVDLDVARQCAAWLAAGRRAALVTVMRTWGSSPRPAGAMMAIRDDAHVAGSVSGGCIEDDLIDKVAKGGVEALAPQGVPSVVTYGVSAEEAQRVGLPCGGTLQLAIEPLSSPRSRMGELMQALAGRDLVRRTLDLRTGEVTHAVADPDEGVHFDADRLVNVLGATYRLLVIGAGQLSRYLCQTAVGLGFDVTVCDPRAEYADSWQLDGVTLRRDMPDDVVQSMRPDTRTAVIALTHDPKLDDLALMDALRTPAFYVGALGSRGNQAKRRQRLTEHFGLSSAELQRLHGPAGLYIGSRTPPEIALSILAQIVAVKNGVALPLLGVGPVKDAQDGGGSGATCAGADRD